MSRLGGIFFGLRIFIYEFIVDKYIHIWIEAISTTTHHRTGGSRATQVRGAELPEGLKAMR